MKMRSGLRSYCVAIALGAIVLIAFEAWIAFSMSARYQAPVTAESGDKP
jgi:hypothetical protein